MLIGALADRLRMVKYLDENPRCSIEGTCDRNTLLFCLTPSLSITITSHQPGRMYGVEPTRTIPGPML